MKKNTLFLLPLLVSSMSPIKIIATKTEKKTQKENISTKKKLTLIPVIAATTILGGVGSARLYKKNHSENTTFTLEENDTMGTPTEPFTKENSRRDTVIIHKDFSFFRSWGQESTLDSYPE